MTRHFGNCRNAASAAWATPAGIGSSQGHFVVLSKPDFKLAAAPDRGETVLGDTYVFALNVVPSGGFLGMVRLAVSGLPAQLTGTVSAPQLGSVGYAYFTAVPAGCSRRAYRNPDGNRRGSSL